MPCLNQVVLSCFLRRSICKLSRHKIIVKTGVIVDASVIETPLRPKGKTNHEVTTDREDEQEAGVHKTCPSRVDQEASWLKKSGKYH